MKKQKRKHWFKVRYILILLVGFIFYILIGAVIPYLFQPDVSEKTKEEFKKKDFYRTSGGAEKARIIADNEEALEKRIRLIEEADRSLILSSFEIHSDTSGKQIITALRQAAERGVEVRIIVDGFPAILSMRGNEYFRVLSETENVEIRLYNPPRILKPWKLMGRLHDKYLIMDDEKYIIGGRNTFDFFLGGQKSHKNYDWDVFVDCMDADDASVNDLLAYFEKMWTGKDAKPYEKEWFPAGRKKTERAEQELDQLYLSMKEKNPDWFEISVEDPQMVPVENIELLSNPIETGIKEPVVFYELTELMKNAKKEVNFHTPYIISNKWMLERLKSICDEVENVHMMTNSVANNGNPFGAMDYHDNKGKILDTGVKIREYDDGISYHGKCMTVDDDLLAVGSFNWDMRSVYLNTELMLVVHSEELNAQLKEEMAGYEENALTVVNEEESIAPEGVIPQEIDKKQKTTMNLIRLVKWARFLM